MTTIEGLRDHPLVDAFVRARRASSAASARPGRSSSAAALVEANAEPTRDEIRHAMAGNICRCGAYPKIEEAIRTGTTDPHREGSRRPARGGLARRRGGRARAVARRPARDRRPPGDADRRPGARARRGPLHRRPEAAGDAARCGAALAACARAREADRPRGRARRARCARRRSGPARSTGYGRARGLPGRAGRRGRGRHVRPGARTRSISPLPSGRSSSRCSTAMKRFGADS